MRTIIAWRASCWLPARTLGPSQKNTVKRPASRRRGRAESKGPRRDVGRRMHEAMEAPPTTTTSAPHACSRTSGHRRSAQPAAAALLVCFHEEGAVAGAARLLQRLRARLGVQLARKLGHLLVRGVAAQVPARVDSILGQHPEQRVRAVGVVQSGSTKRQARVDYTGTTTIEAEPSCRVLMVVQPVERRHVQRSPPLVSRPNRRRW